MCRLCEAWAVTAFTRLVGLARGCMCAPIGGWGGVEAITPGFSLLKLGVTLRALDAGLALCCVSSRLAGSYTWHGASRALARRRARLAPAIAQRDALYLVR